VLAISDSPVATDLDLRRGVICSDSRTSSTDFLLRAGQTKASRSGRLEVKGVRTECGEN
jgi:hypothetical protein